MQRNTVRANVRVVNDIGHIELYARTPDSVYAILVRSLTDWTKLFLRYCRPTRSQASRRLAETDASDQIPAPRPDQFCELVSRRLLVMMRRT